MPTTINHITVDSHDPSAQARRWCEVFGVAMDPEDFPGDPAAVVHQPAGPSVFFEQVPEGRSVTNRVHLDLTPETTRDEEVVRLHGLGASQVADHRRPDGTGWVTMTDPEGNEFCVERSAAERAASA
ncbi:VOC family protein [Dermatophilaceae bacterium Soc4.6]